MAQLSYTNADIAERFVRTQTTTTPEPTTKKTSFFGGIRNIFRKESTTVTSLDEIPTTPTTPTTPKTPANPTSTVSTIAAGLAAAKQAVVAPVVPNNPAPSTTTAKTETLTTPTTARPLQPLHDFESFATITLTTKPPKVKEDFPALPSRPNQREQFPALPAPRQPQNGGVHPVPTASPIISTTANAWSSLPTTKPVNAPTTAPPRVNFVPNGQPTTPRGITTSPTVSSGETTNAELETLTEALFTKENSLISTVSVNYQAKTQSSGMVDFALLP